MTCLTLINNACWYYPVTPWRDKASPAADAGAQPLTRQGGPPADAGGSDKRTHPLTQHHPLTQVVLTSGPTRYGGPPIPLVRQETLMHDKGSLF